ncbi:MAG TPA: hypothetical protein VEK12_05945, partial [Alphaproteobacteria bacterium]|nr:hypothetical protein [Alphaproteobacteria bacterium]
STNTTEAYEGLAERGCLESQAARELVAATRLWRRVQGILRLAEERDFAEERAPEGLRRVIARAAGAADFLGLKDRLTATAERVRRHFAALIETPAAERAAASRAESEAQHPARSDETSEATKEALP